MIADAAYAEFPEVGEILADLRTVDAACLSQGVGGNDLHIVADIIFQNLNVGRQALYGGSGNVFAFRRIEHGVPSKMPQDAL